MKQLGLSIAVTERLLAEQISLVCPALIIECSFQMTASRRTHDRRNQDLFL